MATFDVRTLVFEIDGKTESFDAFYDESDFPFGALYGSDETTQADDKVRNFHPTSSVFSLAAYRKNEDGTIFGIQGLFKNHLWCALTEDDKPMLKLWDRII